MIDPTPPTLGPMPDDARARVRARLLEETHQTSRPRWPWLVPVGAAAAVLAIALGAGYAAFRPAGDTVPAPAPATTRPSPSVEGPTSAPEPTAAPEPPGSKGQIAREGCAKAVVGPLDGLAEQRATWPLPDGAASVWATDDGRSVLCAQNGVITTLHEVRSYPVGSLRPGMLGWSTDTYKAVAGLRTVYVAGGALPEGVTGITYTFPGGHEQQADIRDGWWLMAHAPTDGPLTARGLNVLELPPVRVTVALSGVQEEYELSWPEHMCAQVNHGC